VPASIDEHVARLKLAAAGVSIDALTPDQRDYLADWRV
jgi:adenosylhomocysteinase